MKLSLNSKLKQIESEKEVLQEQLEEEEESKKNMEKQIVALNLQITESRKKMEEEAEQTAVIEAAYKKIIKVCIVSLVETDSKDIVFNRRHLIHDLIPLLYHSKF